MVNINFQWKQKLSKKITKLNDIIPLTIQSYAKQLSILTN